jgi:hypothetical protein
LAIAECAFGTIRLGGACVPSSQVLPGISQIARRIELLDFPTAVDRRVPSLVPVNTLGEIRVKQVVEVPPLIESRFKLSVNRLDQY